MIFKKSLEDIYVVGILISIKIYLKKFIMIYNITNKSLQIKI